jgi:hypothetical protein
MNTEKPEDIVVNKTGTWADWAGCRSIEIVRKAAR